MKILITGGKGMLGRSLQQHIRTHQLVALSRQELDVTQLNSVTAAMEAHRPDVVIHCASMTAVDKCESEIDQAWRANATGSGNVAIACHRARARLIAISTDYVFSGALNRPYHEWDATSPLSVYGVTKLAGEQAVRDHCPDHVILRLGWLYGPGGPSFVHAMIGLAQKSSNPIKVVDDQSGNPTSTIAVSRCIAELLDVPITGVVHATCEGSVTRYELAKAILSRLKLQTPVVPCLSTDFPRPAARPPNAQLEKRALRLHGLRPMPDWSEELDRFLAEYS